MKVGDKVLVYGHVVDWRLQPKFHEKNYWFCRGSSAQVVGVLGKTEMNVEFDAEPLSPRPLTGKILAVHPKQCRKVRS